MAHIFGNLQKRRKSEESAPGVALEAEFSFEDRADLFNDLLEDDVTTFPLLDCPPEVLSAVLQLSEASVAVRLRPLCSSMRAAVDGNAGLWSLLTIRDFADMGGLTKHYRGLRTLADAWDDSRVFARLEWDPLMICAPPPLRYVLFTAAVQRRRHWNEYGHALGAGWAWFSSKVCRRMAVATFFRWASTQYDESALHALLGPLGQSLLEKKDGGGLHPEEGGVAQNFRCGRSDAVKLSSEAVSDIYETVQRWHSQAHKDMMRDHFRRKDDSSITALGSTEAGSFSATPTLDAAEAASFAAGEAAALADDTAAEQPAAAGREGTTRGAASRHIEEAQLRLALELSRQELEGRDEASQVADMRAGATATPRPQAGEPRQIPADQDAPRGGAPALAAAEGAGSTENGGKSEVAEPIGLPLQTDLRGPSLRVFLKDHCLAERVDWLPESLEKSIEHIVHKMATPSSWGLLYESVTEELGFRAKCAAHALCAKNVRAVDAFLSGAISLQQERMCLPIWRKIGLMPTLSRLRPTGSDPELQQARNGLLRQASLEWCEMEDLTEFMDNQLAPLELAIDNFRGLQEVSSKAHTPHVRDIGRLMHRNFCLLDSRVFKPLCLAAYSLVHEVHAAKEHERRYELVEILEGFHAMLVACDVADDHLSVSKHTKEAFAEHLVVPVSAALERLSDWDLRGHPSRDRRKRGMC